MRQLSSGDAVLGNYSDIVILNKVYIHDRVNRTNMKTAVIGAGRWGTNYIRTFAEIGADVRWICARSEETLKKAADAAKAKAKATTSYEDILNDGSVEAVAIVTPGSTHYQIAKDALRAGKHVLVEKPLTLNSKEALELVDIARKEERILMVGHLHRFNPAIRKIREDIEAGAFGKIIHINSVGTGNGPVRSDMSALWDFGPHDVSIAAYLLGKYPEYLSANGASFLKKGVEDVITMDMKFSGNEFATAFGSWLYPVKRMEVAVAGEKALSVYDDYEKRLRYVDSKSGSCREVKFANEKPLTEQLRHFMRCVEEKKKPVTDGTEGAKVIQVLEAAEKSMNSGGKPVKVHIYRK